MAEYLTALVVAYDLATEILALVLSALSAA